MQDLENQEWCGSKRCVFTYVEIKACWGGRGRERGARIPIRHPWTCPKEGQWCTRQDTCEKQGEKSKQKLSLVPGACLSKEGKTVHSLEALVSHYTVLSLSSSGWQNEDDTGNAPESWIKNCNSIRWPSMGGRQEQLTNFSPLWGFN